MAGLRQLTPFAGIDRQTRAPLWRINLQKGSVDRSLASEAEVSVRAAGPPAGERGFCGTAVTLTPSRRLKEASRPPWSGLTPRVAGYSVGADRQVRCLVVVASLTMPTRQAHRAS